MLTFKLVVQSHRLWRTKIPHAQASHIAYKQGFPRVEEGIYIIKSMIELLKCVWWPRASDKYVIYSAYINRDVAFYVTLTTFKAHCTIDHHGNKLL